jgi:hypothetical protein
MSSCDLDLPVGVNHNADLRRPVRLVPGTGNCMKNCGALVGEVDTSWRIVLRERMDLALQGVNRCTVRNIQQRLDGRVSRNRGPIPGVQLICAAKERNLTWIVTGGAVALTNRQIRHLLLSNVDRARDNFERAQVHSATLRKFRDFVHTTLPRLPIRG